MQREALPNMCSRAVMGRTATLRGQRTCIVHTNTKSNYKTLIGIPLFYVPSTIATRSRTRNCRDQGFRELKHTKPLPSGQREKQRHRKRGILQSLNEDENERRYPFNFHTAHILGNACVQCGLSRDTCICWRGNKVFVIFTPLLGRQTVWVSSEYSNSSGLRSMDCGHADLFAYTTLKNIFLWSPESISSISKDFLFSSRPLNTLYTLNYPLTAEFRHTKNIISRINYLRPFHDPSLQRGLFSSLLSEIYESTGLLQFNPPELCIMTKFND